MNSKDGRPVEMNGVKYNSATEAARANNMTVSKLQHHLVLQYGKYDPLWWSYKDNTLNYAFYSNDFPEYEARALREVYALLKDKPLNRSSVTAVRKALYHKEVSNVQ